MELCAQDDGTANRGSVCRTNHGTNRHSLFTPRRIPALVMRAPNLRRRLRRAPTPVAARLLYRRSSAYPERFAFYVYMLRVLSIEPEGERSVAVCRNSRDSFESTRRLYPPSLVVFAAYIAISAA